MLKTKERQEQRNEKEGREGFRHILRTKQRQLLQYNEGKCPLGPRGEGVEGCF